MNNFRHRQRIIVKTPDTEHAALKGIGGTVHRVKVSTSTEAWVAMDRIPHGFHTAFPADDPRHSHVMLYADECKEETGRR